MTRRSTGRGTRGRRRVLAPVARGARLVVVLAVLGLTLTHTLGRPASADRVVGAATDTAGILVAAAATRVANVLTAVITDAITLDDAAKPVTPARSRTQPNASH